MLTSDTVCEIEKNSLRYDRHGEAFFEAPPAQDSHSFR